MGPDFLDHQLRQIRRATGSLSAPEGVESAVWSRIRLQESAGGVDLLHLPAGIFRSSVLLAAGLGFLLPWGLTALSHREAQSGGFDSRLFSVHAPVLPSTRLRGDPASE